jgi:hypothetical protein
MWGRELWIWMPFCIQSHGDVCGRCRGRVSRRRSGFCGCLVDSHRSACPLGGVLSPVSASGWSMPHAHEELRPDSHVQYMTLIMTFIMMYST